MDSSNAKDFCVIVSYVGPDADSMVSQVLPMNAPLSNMPIIRAQNWPLPTHSECKPVDS